MANNIVRVFFVKNVLWPVRVLGFGFKEAFDAGICRLAYIPPSHVPTTSDGAHSRKEKKRKLEKHMKKTT